MKDDAGVQKKKTARKVDKAGVPYFLFDPAEAAHVVELLRAGDPALNLSIAINPLEAFEATLESTDARADATRRLINSLRAQDADLVELNWNKWIAACTAHFKYHAEPKRIAQTEAAGGTGGLKPKRKRLRQQIVSAFHRARLEDEKLSLNDAIEQLETSRNYGLTLKVVGNRKQRAECLYIVTYDLSDEENLLEDELKHSQMNDLFKAAKKLGK